MERRTAHSMQSHSEGPPESLRPSTDLFLPRRRRTELPDRKTERHAYLRRSEVVLMPPTEVTSAFLPNVAVVIRTKIAQSCRSLDAPIFSEGPSVPVCHTRPIQGPPWYLRSLMPRNFMPPTLKSAYRRCTPRKCPSKRLRNQCRISGCIIQNLNFRLSLNVQGLYPASISNVILGVNPISKPALRDAVVQ